MQGDVFLVTACQRYDCVCFFHVPNFALIRFNVQVVIRICNFLNGGNLPHSKDNAILLTVVVVVVVVVFDSRQCDASILAVVGTRTLWNGKWTYQRHIHYYLPGWRYGNLLPGSHQGMIVVRHGVFICWYVIFGCLRILLILSSLDFWFYDFAWNCGTNSFENRRKPFASIWFPAKRIEEDLSTSMTLSH